MSFELKNLFPPSEFTLGGRICIGKRTNCEQRIEPYWLYGAYVHLNTLEKDDFYYIVMIPDAGI